MTAPLPPSRTAAGSAGSADSADSHRPSASTVRALGRLAAGTASAAVLVTGALFTLEWSGRAEDTLGFGPIMISLYWGVAALLLGCLVVPAWRGSTRGRRLLGVASLAGFAGALQWLSYGAGDARGYAVSMTVAVLLGTATAATALTERRLHSCRGLGAALVAVLIVSFAGVLWRLSSASQTVAVDAELTLLADGRTVRSDFGTDPCGEPLRLEIVETPHEVRVLTLVKLDRGFPRGCSGVAVPRRLLATLDAPLGLRVLRPA